MRAVVTGPIYVAFWNTWPVLAGAAFQPPEQVTSLPNSCAQSL
jgi:hypothetical protein